MAEMNSEALGARIDQNRQAKANLLMRNYQGFLGGDGRMQSNRSS